MATEIERKFLIDPIKVPYNGDYKIIKQGYLLNNPVVRVRKVIKPAQVLKNIKEEKRAFITIKSKGNLSRKEYEFKIPYFLSHILMLFAFCSIYKIRSHIKVGNHVWEVDEFITSDFPHFHMAEIELKSEDEEFDKPFWALEEVTHDSRYSNINLAKYGIPKKRKTI